MKKENYLIVDSPFQLLCGIEYAKAHNIGPTRLIIVNNRISNRKQIEQINKIYKSYKGLFSNKTIYPIKTSGYFTFHLFLSQYGKIIDEINSSSRVNEIIIGDYGNCYFRHLSNAIEGSNTVVLDDGFGTIKTASNITSNSIGIKEQFKVLLSLFTYKPFYNLDVNLFTIFYDYVDLKRKKKNSFSNLSKDVENLKKENEVHIIGSPLVEDNIVNFSTYFGYLKKVCDKYSEKKTVYLPHRREQESKVTKIAKDLDIEIKEVDKTIEIFELHNKYLPSNIVSFFSTALFNLNKLLPNQVEVSYVRLKNSEILTRNTQIGNIYKVLNKEISEELFGDV